MLVLMYFHLLAWWAPELYLLLFGVLWIKKPPLYLLALCCRDAMRLLTPSTSSDCVTNPCWHNNIFT